MTGDGIGGWCSDGTVTALVLLDMPGEDTSSGGVTSSPMLPLSAIFMALPLISLGCSCEQTTDGVRHERRRAGWVFVAAGSDLAMGFVITIIRWRARDGSGGANFFDL